MSFYIYQFILVMALSFGVAYSPKICSRTSRVLVFFAVLIPAALRYGIGFDYFPNYFDNFDLIELGCAPKNYGLGFLAICKFVLFYELDFQWIFAIASFLTCLMVFAFPKKGFCWCMIGFMVTIYLSSYNAIRQEIAVMFGVFAFVLGIKRKYVLSALMVAVGCLFHDSLLIVVPLTLVAIIVRRMPNKSIAIGFLVVMALVLILRPFELFVSTVTQIPFLNYYGSYLQSDEFMNSGVGGSGLGILLWIVVWTMQGFWLLFFGWTKVSRMVAIWCFVAAITVLAGAQTRILARFSVIVEAILPFSLMLFARRARGKCSWFFYATVGLVLLSFFHDYGFNSNVDGPNAVIPYKSILDKL